MLPLLPEHSLRYLRFKRAAPGRRFSRQGTVALTVVVGHLLTSYQIDACCSERGAVCWWASIDHYRETIASSVRSLCKPLRYRVHVWLWRQRASKIVAFTAKASKGAPSMVHRVGRAPGLAGPRYWVDPDGQPAGTSIWRHWWPPGCCRSYWHTQFCAAWRYQRFTTAQLAK